MRLTVDKQRRTDTMSARQAQTGTRRIAIRLSEERAKQLEAAARSDGRTTAGMAAKIITDFLRRAAKSKEPTQ